MKTPPYERWSELIQRPLRWRNLPTQIQMEMSNGCGAKRSFLNPPDLVFTDNCNHHDFNYWLGGTEADRIKADYQWYVGMWESAQQKGRYVAPGYVCIAAAYYSAVRTLGKPYFNYSSEERTWDDLLFHIVRKRLCQ